MTGTMDLADAYADAYATEHHSCLFGMPDEFQEAIADKQKARVALEQRIKELEGYEKNVQVMLEALKDAHAHIDYDLVRERIGNVIASVEANNG